MQVTFQTLMFLYHPAYDLKHSAFRILLFTEGEDNWIEPEKLQILEYYFLFPRQISEIRVDPLFTRSKNTFKSKPQYELIPNPLKIFYEIEHISQSAINQLLINGYLVKNTRDNSLKRSAKILPPEIVGRIEDAKKRQPELLEFLVDYLKSIELKGPNGLKDRTRLLPHSHDRIDT